MKVVIVEDEVHNSRMLAGMINKLRPAWEIVETFESVKSAVNYLQFNAEPELYFMDIQLTDGLCFSIFEQVDLKNQVIFTTAYNEYAIQAFKVNSVDYLLKPLKEQKLLEAIEKYEKVAGQIRETINKENYNEIIEAIRNNEKKFRKRFLVAGATSFFKIDVKDIAYFYTEERATFAVTFEGKEHVINHTLEKLEEQIDPEMFYRANRGMILNSEAVGKIENYFGGKLIVKLIHPFKIPVTISRLKATAFKDWLDS